MDLGVGNPRSVAKWLRVPAGNTAKGRPPSAARTAAALTVPSPPAMPSASPRRRRPCGLAEHELQVATVAEPYVRLWQAVRSSISAGTSLPAPLLTTAISPCPAGSAGTGTS